MLYPGVGVVFERGGGIHAIAAGDHQRVGADGQRDVAGTEDGCAGQIQNRTVDREGVRGAAAVEGPGDDHTAAAGRVARLPGEGVIAVAADGEVVDGVGAAGLVEERGCGAGQGDIFEDRGERAAVEGIGPAAVGVVAKPEVVGVVGPARLREGCRAGHSHVLAVCTAQEADREAVAPAAAEVVGQVEDVGVVGSAGLREIPRAVEAHVLGASGRQRTGAEGIGATAAGADVEAAFDIGGAAGLRVGATGGGNS